jgi:hypothetical protein
MRATTTWLILLALVPCLCSAGRAAAQEAPDGDAGTAAPAPEAQASEGEPEGASAPAPVQATDGRAPALDLSRLRAELSAVMDELIQARTRVSVLEKSLFKTSLDVTVVRRADDQRLSHLVLRLDAVPVHESDGATLSGGEAKLFDGFAAPGAHELEIEVSEASKENDTYRYTRKERFRFEVRKGTRTHVEIVLRDRSDMAEELPAGDDGEYDVRTLIRIEPEEVEER